MKHTPGPWSTKYGNTVHAGEYHVCTLVDDEYIENRNQADAHLIAAAPDLLEALRALISHPPVREILAPRESLGSLLALAEGAIAMAEGQGQ